MYKYILLFFFLFFSVANAQFRELVINECMPNNSNTAVDQDGEYNDWVELYNNSTNTINIEGCFLSDRKSQPTKFRFPNIQLNSNEYLIVWLDKDTLQQGLHTNFKLSASGEQVYLFNVDTNLIDFVHFTNVDADISIARNFDGNGSFKLSSPTFNQSNGYKENGVVVNEWMANNTNTVEDESGEFNDWIELYNNTDETINLAGYFLSNKASNPSKYTFPNITISAYDYLILWADEDTLQGDLHLPFKLDSERDDIVFSRIDTSTIDYFFHTNIDSNITMSRIPNGLGDIAIGNATFELTNLLFVSLNEQLESDLLVYPNPCSSYIKLTNLTSATEYVDLLDANGKHLNRFPFKNENLTLNISNYSSGIYFIKTSNNMIKEIVIQKND